MRIVDIHLPSRKTTLFVIVFFMIVGSLTSALVYYYFQYQKVLSDPSQVNADELKKTTTYLQTFMELPTEVPTLASVTDVQALKDQPFFINAQNGDQILMYPNDKKVILFRPSTKKVINVAPLSVNEFSDSMTSDSEAEVTERLVTVALYNGSSSPDTIQNIEQQLRDMDSITINSKGQAKKLDYTKSLVVDLAGGHDAIVAQLATKIEGVVSKMPEGEEVPNADVLIIAGGVQ